MNCISIHSYQVGSNTQVFPDGVVVLRRYRGLPDPRPLAVNLSHGVLGDFGEHHLGCVMLLQG